MENLGSVTQEGDRGIVRHDRQLVADPHAIWTLWSTNEGLSAWLAPSTIDAEAGGAVHVAFAQGDPVHGEIRTFEPPRHLAFTWCFPGEAGHITLQLDPRDAGTQLTLVHDIGWAHARGYGAGWHTYLDRMEDVLAGETPRDFMARVMELMPVYRPAEAR